MSKIEQISDREVNAVNGAGLLGATIGAVLGSGLGPAGVVGGAIVGHFAEETIKALG